jgi:hypothetical protein
VTAPAPDGRPLADAAMLATVSQLGAGSLAWLHEQHQQGRGVLTADTIIDITDPDNDYKPLGECALAASLVLREQVAGARDKQRAHGLLEFAWQQLRSGDMLYERQLRHLLVSDPLETYGHFARAGYRHEALAELLGGIAGLRAAHAVEMYPNRKLAVANARRLAGIGGEPDWAALAAATWLGALPEPWAIDWATGYSVTHTVFHLTDWGARPHGLPAPMRSYLRDWLPVWADIWLELGQWDLATELLIVDACLDEPACDPDNWRVLAAVQHEDGLLPRDTDPVEDDPERAFKDHEHTAVASIIAATLTLSRALGARGAPCFPDTPGTAGP